MTRRESREHCFKMLFSADFYPTAQEAKDQLAEYVNGPEEDEIGGDGQVMILHKADLTGEEAHALRERVSAVMDKIPELDGELNQTAAGWRTRRMGKVELTILRLALYEMRYDPTVPEKVAINEAVELAKKFGGSESPSFVNGILAKFAGKEEAAGEKAAADGESQA